MLASYDPACRPSGSLLRGCREISRRRTGKYPLALERQKAQPCPGDAADRACPPGPPPAGRRLAPWRGHRTDHCAHRAGRIQPVVSGPRASRRARPVAAADRSAVGSLPGFLAWPWPVPGAPVAGPHPRRRRITVGLRTGATGHAAGHCSVMAGRYPFRCPAAPAAGCRGPRLECVPVPPRRSRRDVFTSRPAAAPGAHVRGHAHPCSQMPRPSTGARHPAAPSPLQQGEPR